MKAPEIAYSTAGKPHRFFALAAEVEEAVKAIPDEILVAALAAAGGRELPVDEIRERLLETCRERAAREPVERVLALADAARELQVEPRRLRYQLEQGDEEFADRVRHLPRGLALAFPPRQMHWSLVPRGLRPDPRLALLESGS